MKKNLPIKCLEAVLAVSLAFSATACKKDTKETSQAETTTSATTQAATQETTTETSAESTEATTANTTDATDTTDTTSASDASSSSEPSVLPLKGSVPDKGCKIDFKKQEDRYHYNMDLNLDTEKNTIGGHVEFTFYNDSEADWDKLCLRDYSSLFINAETAGYDGALKTHGATTKIENIVDGRSNEKIEMERDKDVSVVWLPLATKLAPGEKMTLSYDFEAKIPTVADRYGVQDGVFNVTNFYPILAEYTKDGWSHEKFFNCGECFYSEISDYDVKITLPSDTTILTTGLENGETTTDGKKTQSFHADCVRDFVFCASKDFKVIEGDYKDTHIRVAYIEGETPESNKSFAEQSLSASIESLRVFGEAFGEYPYKDLEVVLAPIDAGGMEYPNLVIITNQIDKTMEADPDYLNDYIKHTCAEVVSHEIGHQWFMGIIGSNSGMQPWLDESFASYTEVVYSLATDPEHSRYKPMTDAEKEEWERFKEEILKSQDPDTPAPAFFANHLLDEAKEKFLKDNNDVPINRSFYSYPNDMGYVYSIYETGREALYNLSDAIGYDNFNGIIREYIQRNAFTNTDQSDFFEVLYELAGTDNERLNYCMSVYFDENGQPNKAS